MATQRSSLFCLLASAFLILLAVGLRPVDSAAVHHRRSVSGDGKEQAASETKPCHSRTPCGWAVYIPFTRRIDYHMKNTCECAEGKVCVQADDDLSVSAYVFRCRVLGPDEKDTMVFPY